MIKPIFHISILSVILSFSSCSENTTATKPLKTPTSIEELGELLFNDSLLSRGNQVSCASCHKAQFAFADNTALSFGVDSTKGGRNTPSAMNLAGHSFYFWDGRSETIEDQTVGPIENPIEMDIPLSEVVRRLNAHPQYQQFFVNLFGHQADKQSIVAAISAYENSLSTNNTAFDNYMNGKDTTQFTAAAKRGHNIFNVKGKCFDCHFGPDFTTDQFKNIGLFNGKDINDSGRFVVTRHPNDIGRFKVPGLRNIAVTAPYMHDGRFKTLKEVIDYYNQPDTFIPNAINRDTLLKKPLALTPQEKQDLEAFLVALTDKQFIK